MDKYQFQKLYREQQQEDGHGCIIGLLGFLMMALGSAPAAILTTAFYVGMLCDGGWQIRYCDHPAVKIFRAWKP
jgi:hypothetical protein